MSNFPKLMYALCVALHVITAMFAQFDRDYGLAATSWSAAVFFLLLFRGAND